MEDKKESVMDLAELKKSMIGKAVIKSTDMTPDVIAEAQDIIVSGIENFSAPTLHVENAAKYIKDNLEKKYGPSWQVILGEGYAYDVTVQNNTLLCLFYNGVTSALIYKS